MNMYRYTSIIVILFTTLVMLTTFAIACSNPADSFAFEVLLNKPGITYNLAPFKDAENVNIKNGAAVYRSHYNSEVAVIIQEVMSPVKGLSVRLQVPTKTVKISSNQTLLEMFVNRNLTPDVDLIESMGYEVLKRPSGEVSIIEARKGSPKNGSVEISIFSKKSEDGLRSWFSATIRNKALTGELLKELKIIATSSGITEDEWNNARIETKTVDDIDLRVLHDYLESFDFKSAVKVELEWLKENGIISGLTDSDIQQISQLAKAGLAGHNSRLVWENGWKPYYETSNPLLVKGINCEGFSAENLPEGELTIRSHNESLDILPVIILLSAASILLWMWRK